MTHERKIPRALFDDNRSDDNALRLPGPLNPMAQEAQHTRNIALGVASLLEVLDWDASILAYQNDTEFGDPLEPTLFGEYTRNVLMRLAISSIKGLADRADERLDSIGKGEI